MFCGNCGTQLIEHAKFCGNCGAKVMTTPAASAQPSENLSKVIKQEISSLPLVTLIGDSIKGASGLSNLQEQLKQDYKNPLLWLFYYEGFVTYKKINRGASVARIIYNPVGFAVSKGIATGLNAMDDEFEAFDPKKCLSMSLSLSMEHIKKGTTKPVHLLVAGKALYYMGINEINTKLQEAFFLRSIKYLSLAIQVEQNQKYISEYFFYLSQVYGLAGKKKLQFRSLNISRKMGFMPSLEMIKSELKKKGFTEEKINGMSLVTHGEPTYDFTFTFKQDTFTRLENTVKFAFTEQSKKLKTTTNRIKNFFS
ncbi:zinc ribbon domain-containing protein [Bacillus sp. JJ1566]|uniref:zinc ribbon domain-containing protein n=1 Tax=Bacillus sp. JJ1566 TaxID=3122961 RepID=UPI002FFF753F